MTSRMRMCTGAYGVVVPASWWWMHRLLRVLPEPMWPEQRPELVHEATWRWKDGLPASAGWRCP
jgi:hypothetical protein